jgi:hypothetical protein
MSDPSEWYDHRYWGPAGVDISRWPKWGEVSRGAQYKDLGPVTDGQKGAVRKISSGRKKYRGMASGEVLKKF